MTSRNNILDDFVPEEEFAEQLKVTRRTIKRYRDKDGLSYVEAGGRIYIGPHSESREWLLSRVKRDNPPRAK